MAVPAEPPAPSGDEEFEYVRGQGRPHFPGLLAQFQARSDAVAAQPGCRLDLPYGPHPRQRFDHFPAQAPAQGVLLYLHAGYWQSRDKAQFRFLAPPLQAMGLHVALLNYPLCPDVSLAQLVAAVRPAVAAVRQSLRGQGVPALPLAVAGHSAGAHLAVELALAAHAPQAPADARVDGVLGISGVYDPRPLLGTSLNAKLGLDAPAARAADVGPRCAGAAVPGLWVVGGSETAAFLDQNERMHRAWQAAGAASAACVVPGADHFTVLQNWVDGAAGWAPALAAWWSAVRAR